MAKRDQSAEGEDRESDRWPSLAKSPGLRRALSLLPGLESTESGKGMEYLAYSNSTGSVWLLPADSRDRRAGLALYSPQTMLGRILRQAMRWGCMPRARVWMETERLRDLSRQIGARLQDPGVKLALYAGTPSAHRKITACAIGESGTVAGFAKIAALKPSKRLVENERVALLDLSCSDLLFGRIPEVAGTFEWNDSDVLVMTAGPSTPGPSRLGPPHVEFLKRLHAASATPGCLLDSPSWSRAMDTIERLGSRMPDVWARRYAAAVNRLASGLGKRTMPLSRAHRDFTPWNTTLGPDGLFAFDWEMSGVSLPPLFDVFHFAAVSAALLGRPFRIPAAAGELLTSQWPEGSDALQDLWLAYLTELSIHYTEGRVEHPTEGGDTMWNWQGRELDRVLGRA